VIIAEMAILVPRRSEMTNTRQRVGRRRGRGDGSERKMRMRSRIEQVAIAVPSDSTAAKKINVCSSELILSSLGICSIITRLIRLEGLIFSPHQPLTHRVDLELTGKMKDYQPGHGSAASKRKVRYVQKILRQAAWKIFKRGADQKK
jgi:hypothetical protein